MKKILFVLLVLYLAMTLSAASAMTLSPEAAEASVDTEGTACYGMAVCDAGELESNTGLTVELYVPNTYSADRVRMLKAGDTIVVEDRGIRIAEVCQRSGQEIELIPAEEDVSYIVLTSAESGGYTALIDDRTPCALIGEMEIPLPLPDGFVYLDGPDEEPHTGEAFIRALRDGADEWITPFNTTITLENGIPTVICHSDYPEGPAE